MTFGYLLKRFFFLLIFLSLCCLGALFGAYLMVSSTLPKVETLSDYRPPIITRILGEDGTVIAEIFKERRIVVPITRIPHQLIEAFVSAEDAQFFAHSGIDPISILRAAIKNIEAGGIVQGGSTITQQVAKSLLLSPEKKFKRKFKEAILAWRMEQRLSKEEILYLYLNQIYLGHGAYGVQAAAENYFAKDVDQLTLAESAMLAGLPQAPSRYSPYRHYQRAKERQRYVLSQMVQKGYISLAEAEQASNEPLKIHKRRRRQIAGSAYFTEQVRRYLLERYGEERVYLDGLQVLTSMNVLMQQAAQQAVKDNLHRHARRQGFTGPIRLLSAAEQFDLRQKQQQTVKNQPPEPGQRLEAQVLGGSDQALDVAFGPWSGTIPGKKLKWARPFQVVEAAPFKAPDWQSGERHLPIGSLVQVRVDAVDSDGTPSFSLDEPAKAQGVMVALEPHSGQVKAMVGGYDFFESQFNRAIQARRLPGSAMKPLVYAAALDKGYTPASLILDTPIIYREKSATGALSVWKPRNYGKKFYGPTSMRTALAKSRNVITIKILQDIGVNYTVNYAKKLGIHSPLNHDLTLGLGSSAVTPMELASAYGVFASGGIKVTPTYIRKVIDRNGNVIESIDPADFPEGVGPQQKLLGRQRQRVISSETAYLITNMLESVVRQGTGWRAKVLNRPVAGKTGTTNDLKDAWFIGFVPQLVTVSWVGYDQERDLGKSETGSRAAAPGWVDFMQQALAKEPVIPFPVPDDIEFHPVDPETGLLAVETGEKLQVEAFAAGTAPTRYAKVESRPAAREFFRLEAEDH